MRTPERLRVNDLISSIQEHLEYQGLDALIEKLDENRIVITIPEA